MKYTKPSGLFSRNDVADFLDSLPDSFEIVPEGHVCVKWPEELTRERLIELAGLVGKIATDSIAGNRNAALLALAAIAPEEKKKRKWKWIAWHKDTWLPGTPPILQHEDSSFPYSELGWRKVGECEVTE